MADSLDTVNAARLIDPEDARINIAINSRGYYVRCGVSRETTLLASDWLDRIKAITITPVLISLDQKLDADKAIVSFGTYAYEVENGIAVIFVSSSNQVFFHFWSCDIDTSRDYCMWVVNNLFQEKVMDVLDENTNIRSLTFWGQSGSDYEAYQRKVALHRWEDEGAKNYPRNVLEQLQTLVGLKPPVLGGRIILFHGEPGTGKTTFLRILAREWTKWCHTSVISDPENFLGYTGSMLRVLTFNYDSYIDSSVLKDDAHHLLIIEDADELINADAKRRSGQALSRLLNLSDGLLGQSTRLIICITTNVNIHELHSALSRPGRCLAKVEFTGFNKPEALEWIERHNPSLDANEVLKQTHKKDELYTLAELYEGLAGSKQISHKVEDTVVGQYL